MTVSLGGQRPGSQRRARTTTGSPEGRSGITFRCTAGRPSGDTLSHSSYKPVLMPLFSQVTS